MPYIDYEDDPRVTGEPDHVGIPLLFFIVVILIAIWVGSSICEETPKQDCKEQHYVV